MYLVGADALGRSNYFYLRKYSFLDPCAGVRCGYYGECRSLPNDSVECFCPEACPFIYKPVCGSDGSQYTNECVMKTTSCKKKVLITVAKDGPCKEPTEKPIYGKAFTLTLNFYRF